MNSMQPLIELTQRFRIYAVCIPCGRMELLAMEALVAKLGARATVTDVRLRLRCSRCGSKRPDVRVVYVGVDHEAAGFRYREE